LAGDLVQGRNERDGKGLSAEITLHLSKDLEEKLGVCRLS
jgi:hypothetical protein